MKLTCIAVQSAVKPRPTARPQASLTWPVSNNAAWYNYDVCTWETCGGQALHEVQSVMSVANDSQSWGGAVSNFAFAGSPWTVYGGSARFGTRASIFASETNNGNDALKSITMRATLTVLLK